MDLVLFEIGPVLLWYYELSYAIGLLIINQWVRRRRERLGWSPRDVLGFSLQFAVSVLLDGRVFDVVFYE
jgi:prolipoprotein diacylglyceryltransferase